MEALESPREAPWPPRDPPGVGVVQATECAPEGGGALRRLQKPCQTALGILLRLNAQARWRIDAGNARAPIYGHGKCPAITHSRGSSYNYIDSVTLKYLSYDTLVRLQGSDPRRYDFSMLSNSKIGSLAGNAMTVSVMRKLLPGVLRAIGKQ